MKIEPFLASGPHPIVHVLEQVVPDCIGDLKIGLRSNLSGGSCHLLLPITLSHKPGSPQSSTEICLVVMLLLGMLFNSENDNDDMNMVL